VAEVAPRIHRVGDEIINSYVVETDGEVTIVDAGAPAYWTTLPSTLAAMGRTLDDVRCVLLTHGHSDHIGFAQRASESGIPVRVHEADAALARQEVPNPSRGYGPMKPMPLLRFLVYGARRGLLRIPKLQQVSTFGDGATLDVPGAPTVIHVPGHTPGSAALHFAGHDALFAGDALATYAVTNGRSGPQLAPFTADEPAALESLRRLEAVEASLVLPGHGPAWTLGIRAAVEAVRASEVAKHPR
jgi:glyoxylase-like metal-dependent hydrolase (beta-lactamase superfamily II)